MKAIIVIATLWLVAIAATFIITRETNLFTYLGPVHLICMLGSIVTLRNSLKSQKL
ncbi:hypothetical protein HUU05_18710 [candidate division KSB1 bacterium]|nr:hypothetical protein [candidate division KSB1 bacterium]